MKLIAANIALFLSVACLQAASLPADAFMTLPATSVVARIDGEAVTKAAMKKDADIFMRLNMNRQRRRKIGKQDRNFVGRFLASYVDNMVRAHGFSRYVREKGLKVTAEDRKAAEDRFCGQFGVYSRKLKRRHELKDLKFMLGADGGRLDRFIDMSATEYVATNHAFALRPIVVTDGDVSNRQVRIARYNANAAATNTAVYARATNVWNLVKSKSLAFEEAAKKYSEDVYIAEGCEWGTFSLAQMADEPQLLACLQSMGTGAFTPPVESDNGLAIVRLDEIDDNKCYTLSRIFFRLPMIMPAESAAEARSNILASRAKERSRKFTDEIIKPVVIEYPSGTNLFHKVKK